MPQLDPDSLRAFARRDWSAPERLARVERARQPLAVKLRLAVELYEAMRAAVPGWPDDAVRRQDLACHLRVRALLSKAAHVGAR